MYSCGYKVSIGDINYGGHMGNERALLLFQQCRISWLVSMGYSEVNIGENCGIIQREAGVKYNKEVFLGEELTLRISRVECKRSSFRLYYEIMDSKGDEVISGETLLIPYDYERKKISKIPKEFREKLEITNE